MLGGQRYLLGERLTGPDIRLFHALVRYDEVYHVRPSALGHDHHGAPVLFCMRACFFPSTD